MRRTRSIGPARHSGAPAFGRGLPFASVSSPRALICTSLSGVPRGWLVSYVLEFARERHPAQGRAFGVRLGCGAPELVVSVRLGCGAPELVVSVRLGCGAPELSAA